MLAEPEAMQGGTPRAEDHNDVRLEATAAEFTKTTSLQPVVLFVDSWRIFGIGFRGAPDEPTTYRIQANLYATCFGLDGNATLAHQATIHVPPEAAVRMAMDLMIHAEAVRLGVGRIQQDTKLASATKELVRHRLAQLQKELQDLADGVEPKA